MTPSDDDVRACRRCGGSGHEPDDRAIGERMRRRRKGASRSLRWLAQRLGFTASYLCDLELGRRRWTPDKIKAYERAL